MGENFCVTKSVRNFVPTLFGISEDLRGYTVGCAFAHLYHVRGLVNDNWFLMEVAEVLKWSFLICSVPVAFNGVQTSVRVDAPGQFPQEITATVRCLSWATSANSAFICSLIFET